MKRLRRLIVLICVSLFLVACGKAKVDPEIEALKKEVAELKNQNGILQGENEMLRRRLDGQQSSTDTADNSTASTSFEASSSSKESTIDAINDVVDTLKDTESQKITLPSKPSTSEAEIDTQANVKPDVRNVNFGDSIETVRKKETELPFIKEEKLDNSNKVLYYDDHNVAGVKGIVGYCFNENNELCSVQILFPHTYINPSDYINDYYIVSDPLYEKYGDPTKQNTDLSDLAAYSSDLAHAIRSGYASAEDVWEFDNMTISHIIAGSDSEVIHKITYDSNIYKRTVDAKGV